MSEAAGEPLNPLQAGGLSGRPDGRVFLIVCVGFALGLLYPGLTPWVVDEPYMLIQAIVNNRNGAVALVGPRSTLGPFHGPLVIVLLQGLLHVTQDMVWLTVVKVGVLALALAVVLWLIARRLPYSYWPLLLVPFSPHIWLWLRLVWEAGVLISAGAWALGATASFITRPRVVGLLWVLLPCWMLGMTHMSVIALLAAVAAVLCLQRWRWLLRRWYAVLALVAVGLGAAWPYLSHMEVGHPPPYDHATSLPTTIVASLLPPQIFCHVGFGRDRLPELYTLNPLLPSVLMQFLVACTAIVIPMYGFGLVVGGRDLVRRWRQRERWSFRRNLTLVCAATVVCQTLMMLLANTRPGANYAAPAAFAYLYFAWLAWGGLRTRWRRVLLAVTVTAQVVLSLLMLVYLHQHGGSRSQRFGTTLGEQLRIARQLAPQFPAIQIDHAVPLHQTYPQQLDALTVLEYMRIHAEPALGPEAHYRVQYRNPADPYDAFIELVPADEPPVETPLAFPDYVYADAPRRTSSPPSD